MPDRAGAPRADFAVSDRHGARTAPELSALIESPTGMGFRVRVERTAGSTRCASR